ncbi:MAG: SpoIIE family protein phosphatase [Candidatus Melainabacteria bacterium]|nr:SpoIIE family protein phosphatase [Candidatus Melainabacteria bacterium]
MLDQQRKTTKLKFSEYLSLFLANLEKQSSKDDIEKLVAKTIYNITSPLFLSCVRLSADNKSEIVCQYGPDDQIKRAQSLFNEEFGFEMFEWISKQNKVISLVLADTEKFVFIPLCDCIGEKLIKHGLIMLKLQLTKDEINIDIKKFIEIIVRLSVIALSRLSLRFEHRVKDVNNPDVEKNDLKLALDMQKAMTEGSSNSRLLVKVLEDKKQQFDGNIWWINELNADISILLMAEINCKSKIVPSALLAGYLLGRMNSLKQQTEIALRPGEVLQSLNFGMDEIFKVASAEVNAWYGVINISARKITFANANYPEPYLIGPEQQVSLLKTNRNISGPPLGIDKNAEYKEDNFQVPLGSKLVICTHSMLEQAGRVGIKYDPKWFPQLLETLGSLSLRDMQMSLGNILSERENGTALKPSRLALLLEIPTA